MFVPPSRVAELLQSDELPSPAPQTSRDDVGGQCPQDRTIMSRTNIELSRTQSIHLERCSSCRGVWFDAGEWQLLAGNHLLEHLDEFWTAEWRNKQRVLLDRAEYEERVREIFGPDLYQQLLAVAAALRGHPRRSQALAIIREESES
jgi:Zn-finger nucleic acid-binding protein